MNKKTVLIVEDELDMRIFISTLLETSGYAPVMTRDGKEGLKRAETMEPDIVITDINMPEIEGIEFVKTLKKRNSDVAIIVMSGDELGKKFLKTACMLGAQASLVKPFGIQDLISTVDGVL